jgi:hypothetical protein
MAPRKRRIVMAKAVNDAADPSVCQNNNKGEIVSWTSSTSNDIREQQEHAMEIVISVH